MNKHLLKFAALATSVLWFGAVVPAANAERMTLQDLLGGARLPSARKRSTISVDFLPRLQARPPSTHPRSSSFRRSKVENWD